MVLLILLTSHLKLLKTMIKENNDIPFSVLHLNIRSLNKTFGILKTLLVELNFYFKMICITESWCSDELYANNRYQLPNCITIHQIEKNGKTGGAITILFTRN